MVRWSFVLLLPPFVALLYPPFYARLHPELGGVPFFVWYQFAWVLATAVLTAIVYRIRRERLGEQAIAPPPGVDPTAEAGSEGRR